MGSAHSRDLRQEIINRAKEMFIARGYHGLPMREIAESLGVTKPALYYHFRDKEKLFLAVLSDALDEIERLIVAVGEEAQTCQGRIRLFVERILRLPPEQRAVIRLASQEIGQLSPDVRADFNESYYNKFTSRLEAMLETGISTGELRAVDSHQAAWILLGMMYPYFYPAHSDDIAITPQSIDQIVSIYLDGVISRH